MAKEQTKEIHPAPKIKLPKLPKNVRIAKRPLLHPSITPALSNSHQQKVIYISGSAPFISTIKRVQVYLEAADKRAMGTIDLLSLDAAAKFGKGREGVQEEVVIKASGRAIERALQVALFFKKRPDCVVRLRTGSVGTVDDVVVDGEADTEDVVDIPESRLRRVSTLEVGISLG